MIFARTLMANPGSVGATEWNNLTSTYGNLKTLVISTLAGSGNLNEWNPAMEGGPAISAELSEPHMAMDDIRGNIYVADKNAHAIRKITPDGKIFTVAGRQVFFNPNHGSYDGDGIATQKALSYPNGLFVFPDGTFFILETGDATTLGRIRKVNRAGIMTTLYTDGGNTLQRGLWVAPDESYMYFCTSHKLKKWLATNPGSPVTMLDLSAISTSDVSNIDVALNGNIYVADRGRHSVYSVPPNAVNVTNPLIVAGNGMSDSSSNDNADLFALGRDNVLATSIPLHEVRAVAFHPLGGYFLACHLGGDIYYVDMAGMIHVVIQGGNAGATRQGEGLPITTLPNILKVAKVRSVRVGWNGDLIICTNDNGFLRVVPSICPVASLGTACSRQRQVSWNVTAGKNYFLERSTTLNDLSWQTLNKYAPIANGVGTYLETSPLTTMPRAFYRIYEYRKWPF